MSKKLPAVPATGLQVTYSVDAIKATRLDVERHLAAMPSYAAHSIVHFFEHYDVSMLNAMQFFVKKMARGTKADIETAKIRKVAVLIGKNSLHAKVEGEYAGKCTNKAMRNVIKASIVDATALLEGSYTPEDVLCGAYQQLLDADWITSVEPDADEEDTKSDDQKFADKIVPKSQRGMDKLSDLMQGAMKNVYRIAYNTNWVGS